MKMGIFARKPNLEEFAAFKKRAMEIGYREAMIEVEANCSYCSEVTGGPNHFGSDRCESGRYNHCACDLCF